MKEEKAVVVHVLRQGLPLCGFSLGFPCNWPQSHSWVPLEERSLANCWTCVSAAEAMVPAYKLHYTGARAVAITHTKCGLTSHNPNDIENRYCGNCHLFLEDRHDQGTSERRQGSNS